MIVQQALAAQQALNNNSNTHTPEPPQGSIRQEFYQQAFAESGPFSGLLGAIFRKFTRTMVVGADFDIQFHFVKDTWQIRIVPRTLIGTFAIKVLKEEVIKQELSGKEE